MIYSPCFDYKIHIRGSRINNLKGKVHTNQKFPKPCLRFDFLPNFQFQHVH